MKYTPIFLLLTLCLNSLLASSDTLHQAIEQRADALSPSVIQWRRQIHSNPELGDQEHKTAALIAEHLRRLGFDDVKTGVARTGVVGTLIGAKPGPVVALRADMDALPVVEQTGLPFASKKKGLFQGKEVGIMHACGHDAHVAMLMGVAELMAGMREQLPGTIKFIFQPSEEGVYDAESWGGRLMVEEGALDAPYAPEVVFALHVGPQPSGTINYREGGIMAAADMLDIQIRDGLRSILRSEARKIGYL